MIFPSWRCSITCAHQPAVRAMTKSGVKNDVGTPIIGIPGRDGQEVAIFGPVISAMKLTSRNIEAFAREANNGIGIVADPCAEAVESLRRQ